MASSISSSVVCGGVSSAPSDWSALVQRVTLFAHRYAYDARDEATRLAAIIHSQRLFHRLQRSIRVLHGWRQFYALDQISWVERNEHWKCGSELHELSTYGPTAPWADFLRFLRSNVDVVALLALPPSARAADKVASVLGYSLDDEKAALAEIITFDLYGGAAKEREFESLRALIRHMLRVETNAARAAGTLQPVQEFWRTMQPHLLPPIDRDTHSRAAAGSITTPSPPPTSASAASAAFRSRPLRMIVLDLALRRASGGGAFLASILSDPLRTLLHEDRTNLDPQESVVASLVAGPTLTPAVDPSQSASPTLNSPAAAQQTSTGNFFSNWRRTNTTTTTTTTQPTATATNVNNTPPTTPHTISTAPPNSTKIRQALRVTEQLLCSSVDTILDALLHAGPRWPLEVKLLLGDVLVGSEESWADSDCATNGEVNSAALATSLPVNNFTPSNGSPPSGAQVPYTMAENSILADETASLFSVVSGSVSPAASAIGLQRYQPIATHRPASSLMGHAHSSVATSVPNSSATSVAGSPGGPPLIRRLQTTPFRSTSGPGAALLTSADQPRPMVQSDRPAILAHVLFGMLVLPALSKPNLSGLYLDGPLRTRARLNLKVVCSVVEQVLLGTPFPPSNHLCCLNKYVTTKGVIVRTHLATLADHCVRLALRGQQTTKETQQQMQHESPNASPNSAAIIGTPVHMDYKIAAAEAAPATQHANQPNSSSNTIQHAPSVACQDEVDSYFSSTPRSSSSPSFPVSSAPSLILHRTNVCLTLTELSILHQSLFRQVERLNHSLDDMTEEDRKMLKELQTFKHLPLDGPESEYRGQVFELSLVDEFAAGGGGNGSGSGGPTSGDSNEEPTRYPIFTSLTKKFEERIASECRAIAATAPTAPTTTTGPKPATSTPLASFLRSPDFRPLCTLLGLTLLSVPYDSWSNYAGSRSDLPGLLSHARHALESHLQDEWDSASQALSYIAEVEAEIKRIGQTYFTQTTSTSATAMPQKQLSSVRPPSFSAAPPASITTGQIATRPSPLSLPHDLNRFLFTLFDRLWSSLEAGHMLTHGHYSRSLAYTNQVFRRGLFTLRAEHRFLRELTFANRVLIFACNKKNVAQSIHLGRIRFVLPGVAASSLTSSNGGGMGIPTLERAATTTNIAVSNKDTKASSSSSSPSDFLFTCTSFEGFIQLFESFSSVFTKDPSLASRLIQTFTHALEKAVREDVGLNTSEIGPKTSHAGGGRGGRDRAGGVGGGGAQRQTAIDMHAAFGVDDNYDPSVPPAHGSDAEFLDRPLFGDELVSKAMDLLDHILCTRLYAILFPSDRSSTSFTDELFHWKLKGLGNWLQPSHVHLPGVSKADICWYRPHTILQTLDHAHSPMAKLKILTRALKWMSKGLAAKTSFKHMDADSTLSGLIFLLVKSQPSRLHSNLIFIETFLQPLKLVGEQAYVLTQWSLAAHYVGETLSVYDQASLEAEMAAANPVPPQQQQQSSSPPNSSVSGLGRELRESIAISALSSPSSTSTATLLTLAAAVGPGGARTPSRSRTRASSFAGTNTPGPRMTIDQREPSPTVQQKRGSVYFTGVDPSSPIDELDVSTLPSGPLRLSSLSVYVDDSVAIGPLSSLPGLHTSNNATATSLLAQSLRASRDRERTRASAAAAAHNERRQSIFSNRPAAIVLRTPKLFHIILTHLHMHETALLASVSQEWCAQSTFATRRASVRHTQIH